MTHGQLNADDESTDDESTDEYDLDADYTHDKPIDVSAVSGGSGGTSIHVKETFADGSYNTDIYTEEQGRKLFARLKEIYGDE